jgi:hypothetical protein
MGNLSHYFPRFPVFAFVVRENEAFSDVKDVKEDYHKQNYCVNPTEDPPVFS